MSIIERRLESLRRAVAPNPILFGEVQPFLLHADWTVDDEGTVTGTLDSGGVPRVIEVENMGRGALEVRIGRADFPERKRIPVSA
jgi:hypothetical protein